MFLSELLIETIHVPSHKCFQFTANWLISWRCASQKNTLRAHLQACTYCRWLVSSSEWSSACRSAARAHTHSIPDKLRCYSGSPVCVISRIQKSGCRRLGPWKHWLSTTEGALPVVSVWPPSAIPSTGHRFNTSARDKVEHMQIDRPTFVLFSRLKYKVFYSLCKFKNAYRKTTKRCCCTHTGTNTHVDQS